MILMKMNKTLHLVIDTIFLCAIGILWTHNCNLKSTESAKVDTLTVRDTVYVKDTVIISKPKIAWRTIVDTVLVQTIDSCFVPLPLEQKRYTNDSTYTAWVSGVQPNLDSIHVYNNIIYRNTTNTVHVKDIERKWKTYLFVGGNSKADVFAPSVGIAFTSPENWMFSAETGVMDKDAWFGVKIGYRISK